MRPAVGSSPTLDRSNELSQQKVLRLKALICGSILLHSYEWTTAAPSATHARTHTGRAGCLQRAKDCPLVSTVSLPLWTEHGLPQASRAPSRTTPPPSRRHAGTPVAACAIGRTAAYLQARSAPSLMPSSVSFQRCCSPVGLRYCSGDHFPPLTSL